MFGRQYRTVSNSPPVTLATSFAAVTPYPANVFKVTLPKYITFLTVLLAAFGSSAVSAPQQYQIFGIGTLPGGTSTFPKGINQAGDVVGYASVPYYPGYPGHPVAFFWKRDTYEMFNLGQLTDAYDSRAVAVNDNKDVVLNVDGFPYRWSYRTGQMTQLAAFGGTLTVVTALNNIGASVGYVWIGLSKTKAVRWDGASLSMLPDSPSYIDDPNDDYSDPFGSAAHAIDDAGVAVGKAPFGDALNPGPATRVGAVKWVGEETVEIPSYGYGYDVITAINNRGDMIDPNGFLIQDGSIIPLADTPNGILPQALNNFGDVVGNNGRHAAIWSHGKVTDLTTVVGPLNGLDLLDAVGINDAGEILCQGAFHTASGMVFNAVVLRPLFTPVGPPAIELRDLNDNSVIDGTKDKDTAWITAEPKMPKLQAKVINAQPGMTVQWKLKVYYDRPFSSGAQIKNRTEDVVLIPENDGFTFAMPAAQIWNVYELYKDLAFFGGDATLTARISGHPDKELAFHILARNPDPNTSKDFINEQAMPHGMWYAYAIAKHETAASNRGARFNQFYTIPGRKSRDARLKVGMPVWNDDSDDGSGGYGLFQLTKKTRQGPIPRAQIWNWQDNVRGGIAELQTKIARTTAWMGRMSGDSLRWVSGQRFAAGQVPVPIHSAPRNRSEGAIVVGGDLTAPSTAAVTFDDTVKSDGKLDRVEAAVTIKFYNGAGLSLGPTGAYCAWNGSEWQFQRFRTIWDKKRPTIDPRSYVDLVLAELDPEDWRLR